MWAWQMWFSPDRGIITPAALLGSGCSAATPVEITHAGRSDYRMCDLFFFFSQEENN